MAVTLIDTPKATDANAYATETEGDSYFNTRLGATAWTAASVDDKKRALIMATARLDLEIYEGFKTDPAQALKWPRFGADDDDGNAIDADFIPRIIEVATFETGLQLLQLAVSGTPIGGLTGLEKFESVTVGPISVEPRVEPTIQGIPLTVDVLRILRPVLLVTTENNVRLVRVPVDQPLQFWPF